MATFLARSRASFLIEASSLRTFSLLRTFSRSDSAAAELRWSQSSTCSLTSLTTQGRTSVEPSLFLVWLLEDRILDLDRDGSHDAVAHVLAGEALARELVDRLENALTEARLVRPSVVGVLTVDEAEVVLAVVVRVGEGELEPVGPPRVRSRRSAARRPSREPAGPPVPTCCGRSGHRTRASARCSGRRSTAGGARRRTRFHSVRSKISGSGVKRIRVPSAAPASLPLRSSISRPCSKRARRYWPSRQLQTSKSDESALTAFVPTPLRPTENWKTSSLYLPPVLIWLTHSTTLPRGMPRPKSRTSIVGPSREISTRLPAPMMNSSTALSMTSLSIT